MTFLAHAKFSSELAVIEKKQRNIHAGMSAIEKLLSKQFDPANPIETIGPSKIHRILEATTWEVWKVEVAIPKSGLRPSQWPRVCFAVKGDKIVFLAIAMHSENYDNNAFETLAKSRATDFF